MERTNPQFEYIPADQQYDIAATVGVLRTLSKIPTDIALGGVPTEMISAQGIQISYEASFALLIELGSKDLSSLEQHIISECPRIYTQANNTLAHCLQLQLVDARGALTETAELAFRYEIGDDQLFNEIFTHSHMDRLDSLIDEVATHAYEERVLSLIGRSSLSDALLNYKGYLSYWIGEYDRI